MSLFASTRFLIAEYNVWMLVNLTYPNKVDTLVAKFADTVTKCYRARSFTNLCHGLPSWVSLHKQNLQLSKLQW